MAPPTAAGAEPPTDVDPDARRGRASPRALAAGRRLARRRATSNGCSAPTAFRWSQSRVAAVAAAAGRCAAAARRPGRAQGDRARPPAQARRRRRARSACTAPRPSTRAAREIARRGRARPGHEPDGFLVQAMAAPRASRCSSASSATRTSARRRLRRRRDAVELLGDVAVRLAPLAAARRGGDAARACAPSRCSTATAARRRPTSPRSRTCCCASRALAAAHPEIAELDRNPVIASPTGAVVVDARVRIERPARRPPYPAIGR